MASNQRREKIRVYNKQYYLRNREKIAQQKKIRKEQYIQAHGKISNQTQRAQDIEKRRKYIARNRDRIRANCKQYYIQNREKILAQSREYYWRNREQIIARKKQYRKKLASQKVRD